MPKPEHCIHLYLFIVFLVGSCDGFKERAIDSKAVREEISNRKFKKITEGQFVDWVKKTGDRIVEKLHSSLNQKAPDSLFFSEKEKITDSLEKAMGIKIQKIAFESGAKQNLTRQQKELLEAYQYSLEQKQSLESNVQVLREENAFLYTAPLKRKAQTRGMWSIYFDRKNVVKRINVK